jgi:triphosphoribosyl-dephospho-CoA synthase
LVAAGAAIAPALDRAPTERLGQTILAAVQASSCVTRSNANLGIVLALAPVAAAAEEEPRRSVTTAGIAAVLGRLGPLDAVDVWEAIRLANPGGMGRVSAADLHDPPPADLRAAMAAAAPHDQIARLWTDGYSALFDGLVENLLAELGSGHSLGDAIVRGYLRQLSREPDSLVARRHGAAVAGEVSRGARNVLRAGAGAWKTAAATFDRSLRVPVKINPGTTADLVATALFILLWEGRLQVLVGNELPLAAVLRSPSSAASVSSPASSSNSSSVASPDSSSLLSAEPS